MADFAIFGIAYKDKVSLLMAFYEMSLGKSFPFEVGRFGIFAGAHHRFCTDGHLRLYSADGVFYGIWRNLRVQLGRVHSEGGSGRKGRRRDGPSHAVRNTAELHGHEAQNCCGTGRKNKRGRPQPHCEHDHAERGDCRTACKQLLLPLRRPSRSLRINLLLRPCRTLFLL